MTLKRQVSPSTALLTVEEHVHDNRDYDPFLCIQQPLTWLRVEEHVHDNRDYDSKTFRSSQLILLVEEHVHDNRDYDGLPN